MAARMMQDMRGKARRQVSMVGSMASRMKKMKKSQLQTDFGLLPGTLIHPLPAAKPALFSKATFGERLKVEASTYFGPIKSVISQYTQRDPADPVTGKRPPVRLRLSERYYIARQLHRQFYNALAAGNRFELEKIACEGMQRKCMAKLDQRRGSGLPAETWTMEYRGWTPKGEMQSSFWSWFKQVIIPPPLKSTRMISDAIMPILPGMKIRQTVVQIKGRQTLDKNDGSPVKVRDTNEYVVIQQMITDGEEGNWMIWGTTERSTLKDVEEVLALSRDSSASSNSLWSKVQGEFAEKMGGASNTM